MIAPRHPCEFRCRHVARDALVAFAVGVMMSMVGRVRYALGVTGQTDVVGRAGPDEAVAPAGRVTVHAVELARLDARTHAPGCVGVVLAEVSPVGIEILMFETDEIVT